MYALSKNIIFSLFKNNIDIQSNFNNLIQLINSRFSISLDLVSFLEHANEAINQTEHYVYLTCLSEHENKDNIGRLSMWRAYGHPNGVALVVNKNFMQSQINNSDNIFFTSPVFYTEANVDFISFFNINISKIHDNIDYISSTFNYNSTTIVGALFQVLYYLILSIKHPGFKEEREWRILYSLINENFAENHGNRTSGIKEKNEIINNLPQKIFTLNLKEVLDTKDVSSIQKLLKKIIIGPTAHPEIIKESFVDLLKKKNIPNPENLIEISNIPLRV